MIGRILSEGHQVSPLFQVPWVTSDIFRIDWLHCADQGISADFLGNLFVMLREKCEGRNLALRTNDLWQKIQKFYRDEKVEARLTNLVPTMIKQDQKKPKLRCSAAQCRALIPFAHSCAQELLSDTDPAELAAKTAAKELLGCYKCLSHEAIFHRDLLKAHSIKFALQYVALHDFFGDDRSFALKPKLHLFLELCAEGSKPALFWNYRDEDYGGTVAKLSRRRGGLLSARGFSESFLSRFRIYQPFIRMI